VRRIDLDVAILGGGIAGLWTLARLQQAGYRVALFETSALGGVQSIASQGIIHGGTKYALTGKLTGSAMAIGEMPGLWRAAFTGQGEIDLTGVRLLAEHQYLWSTGSLVSGMAGFFAGKVMQSRMRALPRDEFPPPFDAPAFRGSLYRLDEPVLDVASLAAVLAARYGNACIAVEGRPVARRMQDGWQLNWHDQLAVTARTLVLTAGKGNADLLSILGVSGPTMQLRPLHMLMLRGRLPAMFAHCLGASANPRLTVTSYPRGDDSSVWYLGGQVAEEGVSRGTEAQIEAGRRELATLLPWVELDQVEWAALPIDRAEVETPGHRRPDDAFVDAAPGVVTCWPTKLAFAPRVAALVLAALARQGLEPAGEAVALDGLPHPGVARLPWEDASIWN
jgi:glycerol-3-phosphate dehydrogenase